MRNKVQIARFLKCGVGENQKELKRRYKIRYLARNVQISGGLREAQLRCYQRHRSCVFLGYCMKIPLALHLHTVTRKNTLSAQSPATRGSKHTYREREGY